MTRSKLSLMRILISRMAVTITRAMDYNKSQALMMMTTLVSMKFRSI